MKNYFDSTDVINLINDLKLDIKELWCTVNELKNRTAINIGNGYGLFKKLYRNRYEFKSLIAGNNIIITDNGDDITISSTGGGDTFNCSNLNNCSTDNLPEGSNNLYFTDNRAIAALTGQNISLFNNDVGYITSNFISSVNDTSTIDLSVIAGDLSANFIGDTNDVPEGTNLYYTDTRARNSISLTTTGTSGAATYNSLTGILNIPNYTSPVTSIFGRTGAVIAQSGDYNGNQITNSPSGWVTATTTQTAINQIANFLNPSNTWYFFTDFEGGGTSAATLNSDKIAVGFLGANVTSTILTTSESGAVGVMSLGTGTTATGAVYIGTNAGVFSFGDGITLSEIRVKLPVLSDGTNRFTIRVGFVNSASGDSINGAYFRYVDNVNSGNWQLITRSGGVETAVNTSTTVVANTWIKLSVLTDATASLVTYSVNGVSVGTINSNIGTTNIGMGISIVKSVGTTASLLYCDYQLGMKTFTSAR